MGFGRSNSENWEHQPNLVEDPGGGVQTNEKRGTCPELSSNI